MLAVPVQALLWCVRNNFQSRVKANVIKYGIGTIYACLSLVFIQYTYILSDIFLLLGNSNMLSVLMNEKIGRSAFSPTLSQC